MKTTTILLSSVTTILSPAVCLATTNANQQSISPDINLVLGQNNKAISGNDNIIYP